MIVSCEITLFVNVCSKHDRDEDVCRKWDDLAEQDFTNRTSEPECFHYRQNWWISLNKSGDTGGPLRNRSDFNQALSTLKPFTPRIWKSDLRFPCMLSNRCKVAEYTVKNVSMRPPERVICRVPVAPQSRATSLENVYASEICITLENRMFLKSRAMNTGCCAVDWIFSFRIKFLGLKVILGNTTVGGSGLFLTFRKSLGGSVGDQVVFMKTRFRSKIERKKMPDNVSQRNIFFHGTRKLENACLRKMLETTHFNAIFVSPELFNSLEHSISRKKRTIVHNCFA